MPSCASCFIMFEFIYVMFCFMVRGLWCISYIDGYHAFYQRNWVEIYVNPETPLAKTVASQFLEAPSGVEAQKVWVGSRFHQYH